MQHQCHYETVSCCINADMTSDAASDMALFDAELMFYAAFMLMILTVGASVLIWHVCCGINNN